MRSKVFYKLLLALLITLIVIVALMLIVVNWSFKSGFVSYLQQAEHQRVEHLAKQLGDQYRYYGSWEFMEGGHRRWISTLDSAGIAPPPPPRGRSRRPGPPPDDLFGFREPPFRDEGDPSLRDRGEDKARSEATTPLAHAVPLGHRIALFDIDRIKLQGPRFSTETLSWVAVKNNAEIVAWLGFKPVTIAVDALSQSFIVQQRNSLILVALSVLVVSFLVAMVLARRFLKPIHRVADAAKQLAKGQFAGPVAVEGNDELAELANNFNHMASQLQRNEQLRRQWIADISHELRTPTSLISVQVEAMQDGVIEPNNISLAALYRDIGSLSHLIDDLHKLSVSDQLGMDLKQQDVDLFCLIQSQIVAFQPRAHERNLSLAMLTDWNPGFVIVGDSDRLTQVVTNLLENSIRYTDAGGRILVNLALDKDRLVLEITDDAPGVPDEDMIRIFDRLYRVDRSRSRLLGGSGLGLSICKSIVEAHGGTIKAENREEGGLKMVVALPLQNHELSS